MSEAFAHRLTRNRARLGPWAAREGLEAYRLYDRDVPEVPWTVDRYGAHVLAEERITPVARRQSAEERAAEEAEVLRAIAEVTGVDAAHLHVRRRERHGAARRTETRGTAGHEFPVLERGHRFLVNLTDYGDTGLFLDHRETRRRVGERSRGRRVLNLFCYTGSFTVYAAMGGADSTVSVDLSQTYLAWAERNFAANGLALPRHERVRADVFDFLRRDRERYDLVVLDPPTLSRSQRGRSFDVQQAHVELINRSLERLAPGGTLLFSTNYRRFSLEETRLRAQRVREITRETVPRDFREGIHRCWEIG